jgi:hypothetical protein
MPAVPVRLDGDSRLPSRQTPFLSGAREPAERKGRSVCEESSCCLWPWRRQGLGAATHHLRPRLRTRSQRSQDLTRPQRAWMQLSPVRTPPRRDSMRPSLDLTRPSQGRTPPSRDSMRLCLDRMQLSPAPTLPNQGRTPALPTPVSRVASGIRRNGIGAFGASRARHESVHLQSYRSLCWPRRERSPCERSVGST